MKGTSKMLLVTSIIAIALFSSAVTAPPILKGSSALNVTIELVETDETGTGVFYTPHSLTDFHLVRCIPLLVCSGSATRKGA